MNNKNIVKTSHKLNHFRGAYTKLELDFIYAFISTIKDEDEDFKKYSLPIRELENKLNKRLQLKDIEYLFESLMKKSFKIHNEDELIVYCFFTTLGFNTKTKVLSVKFNPDLKSHLLNLNTFAKGDLRYILQFKSEYTKRFYMLMSQWKVKGHVMYSVEELRELLAVPKSYKYAQFKQKILSRAEIELQANSDVFFTYSEEKREGGRKVTHIIFDVIKSGGTNKEVKLESFNHLLKQSIYYNGENRIILNVWKAENEKGYVLVQLLSEDTTTITDKMHLSQLEKMVEYSRNKG